MALAPVRLVHLGLGNFFRAHQAWYTDQAGDAGDWGYAAFTGRGAYPGGRPPEFPRDAYPGGRPPGTPRDAYPGGRPPGTPRDAYPRGRYLALALAAQGCRYTLVTRGADADSYELIGSVSEAHAGADHQAWLGCLRSPEVSAVTITVTEAGYLRGPDGGLDTTRPEVAADMAALRADIAAPVRTAPARLVAGLAARRLADAGPLAIVPCDNLPSNGLVVRRVVTDFAEALEDGLATWLAESVTVVTTMVDRITPQATAADARAVRAATGYDDRCPVVTEPFSDWVLSGRFPAGRPRWDDCGATFTDDIRPFEERKIWLLNGAHSLLAYAGSIIGHATVADAVTSPTCMTWLTQWWDEACSHLTQPAAETARYRAALLARFQNGRIRDRLDRIAADGSQKLPVRVLPVIRAERLVGRVPEGAARVLAAWICHLRGLGAPVSDARQGELIPLARGEVAVAVRRVLGWLDAELADDRELVALVTEQSQELTRRRTRA